MCGLRILCDKFFYAMCTKAAKINVKDFFYTPTEGEYVEAEASLCYALKVGGVLLPAAATSL